MKCLKAVVLVQCNIFQINAQSKLDFFTDLSEVKTYAQTNQEDVLMVFAGSDWCKPCMQSKKEILESADFQDWAKGELVVLYLDFPARRRNKLSSEQTAHKGALAGRFNKSGFSPSISLIDSEEKMLANPPFMQSLQPTLSAQKWFLGKFT